MIGHSRYYANELHILYDYTICKYVIYLHSKKGSDMKDNQIVKENSIKEVTAKDKK